VTAVTLTATHQQTLIDSAIAADIAAARPYSSVTADDQRLAPFADYQRADGILIAVRPPDGTNGRYQLRRDVDRIRKDGSTARYEQPAGGEHRLDVHPRFRDKLADPSVPLWIGEGIKKGDALASRGVACVSLGGVECGLTPACIEDWKHITIAGRTFIICFDYDPKQTSPGLGLHIRAVGVAGKTLANRRAQSCFRGHVAQFSCQPDCKPA